MPYHFDFFSMALTRSCLFSLPSPFNRQVMDSINDIYRERTLEEKITYLNIVPHHNAIEENEGLPSTEDWKPNVFSLDSRDSHVSNPTHKM